MRDDVMSYGKGVEAVSELTLVAMEGLTLALASGCHPYPYPYPYPCTNPYPCPGGHGGPGLLPR
jgi:hypothetical protein